MPQPLVYVPEWSSSCSLGVWSYQCACEHYSGWAVHLKPSDRPGCAAALVRGFLEIQQFPPDMFDDPDSTREVAAAAFRRGLELVGDITVPCPDPADPSPSGDRARKVWCKVVAHKIARIEAESRVPLAEPRDP